MSLPENVQDSSDSPGNDQEAKDTAAEGAGSGTGEVKNALGKSLVEQLDKKLASARALNNAGDLVRAILTISTLLGLADALKLEGMQFNMLIAMIHIGNMVSPVRLEMVRNKVCKSRASLSGWACVLGLLLFATSSYAQALCLCFLMGIAHTATDMSLAVLSRSWYTASELRLAECGAASANVWVSLHTFLSLSLNSSRFGVGGTYWRIACGAMGVMIAFYWPALAYWKHPGFPETAAWPTQAERALIEQRTTERTAFLNEQQQNTRFTLTVLRNAKLWKMALLQLPVQMARSYITFWPIIFARTLGIEKMTPVWLLASGMPWLIPALLRIGNAKLFRNWKTDPGFFPSQFSLQQVSSLLAFLGVGIACFTTQKFFLVCALYLMPLHDIGHLASLFAFLSSPSALFTDPSEAKTAQHFVNAFGFIGTLFGSFMWPLKYTANFYKTVLGIQGMAIILSLYAVRVCVLEIASDQKARRVGRNVEQGKAKEAELIMLQGTSEELDAKV
ncbi:hypothetical protein NEOLEDRAFT_1133631 [Neolentinus lepideus HHB14362 ss-1]|uniref:MFS general substrate transporter n=1 Tax=Neolentinus lepideus HHB14362 ss-1 TaxID=1314782 RepID=A0A165SK37_9AGAM|nr:hypothetical protein NEOLEDRAFT_1133631 [Neolentinus lepideus HHB14362 ss-1]